MSVSPAAPIKAPSMPEFIALIAMLFATIAISIDAMLPAMPDIAAALTPADPNKAQLVITSFVLGMGVGTLFVGPLSDAYGRKSTILFGTILYAIASVICYVAPSLETLLLARVLQGVGASAARVVSMALVRDLFKGREMAQVVSFAMMIFTVVPAVAPLMGAGVIALAGWREIFLCYVLFAAIAMVWLWLRQPETLPRDKRRPLNLRNLFAATRELLGHRIIVLATLAQALTLGALFGTLSSMQGIFEQRFDRADSFPLWFAFIAMASMLGSILNAKIVVHVGMRAVVIWSYAAVTVLTLVLLAITSAGLMPEVLAFPAHLLWCVALFSTVGLTMGNLNALSMEPVGHIAGLAASVTSSLATVAAVAIAVPIGLAFNGTALPLMAAVALLTGLCAGMLALWARR